MFKDTGTLILILLSFMFVFFGLAIDVMSNMLNSIISKIDYQNNCVVIENKTYCEVDIHEQ